MKNIEQIIRAIKTFNKRDLSFDEQGRLHIRVDKSILADNSILLNYKHTRGKIANNKFLFNGLLIHEDRLVRKNISLWIDELIEQIKLIKNIIEYPPEQLAAIFNLSALVFSLMGEIDRAEILCNKQIRYFKVKAKNDLNLLKYIIQPWINLARLDRIKGDFNQALDKFAQLKSFLDNEKNVDLDYFSGTKNYFLEAIGIDNDVTNVIKTCIFLEPIKTKLITRSYSEVLLLARELPDFPDVLLNSIGYEATIIAHAYLGDFDLAFYLTNRAINELPPHFMHIFLLRKAELYAVYEPSKGREFFGRILDLLNDFKNSDMDINKVYFTAKFAGQLLNCGFEDLSLSAYQKAYAFSKMLKDEILMIECLEALIDLGEDQYKEYLYEILSQTSYASVISRFKKYRTYTDGEAVKLINVKAENLFTLLMAI